MAFIKEEAVSAGYIVDVLDRFEKKDWDGYLKLLGDDNNIALLKEDGLIDILFIESADNGLIEAVKILQKAGANIHAKDDLAIVLASDSGHFELVKYLHESGLSVNAQNGDVMNAAAYNDRLEIVEWLLKNGADFSSVDEETANEMKRRINDKK